MGTPSRSHPRHCATCGQTYQLTNFMHRWANPTTLEVARWPDQRNDGYYTWHTDTHQLAHRRRGEYPPRG